MKILQLITSCLFLISLSINFNGCSSSSISLEQEMKEWTDSEIKKYSNMSEDEQINVLKQPNTWSSRFQYMKNPSEKVQLAAVNQYHYNIKYIDNPSEEVQLAALKKCTCVLPEIKNIPTKKVLLEASKYKNGPFYIFQRLKLEAENLKRKGLPAKDFEEIKLEVLKENGLALEFFKEQNEEIQLLAVKQNGAAIQFVKNPNEELQLLAVKQNVDNVAYIADPSIKVQLLALEKNINSIMLFKSVSLSALKYLAENKNIENYTRQELQLSYKAFDCDKNYSLNETCSKFIFYTGKIESIINARQKFYNGFNTLVVDSYCNLAKKNVYSSFGNAGAEHEALFYRGCMSILSN